MGHHGRMDRRMSRFQQVAKRFEFFVNSNKKMGLTITRDLTVWYSDQIGKFYDESAKLDNWIRELYALQLSLEMMVNTWNVKIATKLSMITALEGTNSKLDITIRQLQSQIVGHKSKLKELTQTIEEKMKTINAQDRAKQTTVDKYEIVLNNISAKRAKTCKAGVGQNLINDMQKIQQNIDRIVKAQSIEKSLYIQISSFMKDTKTTDMWMQQMIAFSHHLGNFMRNIELFKQKAQQLWGSDGAWDRNALTKLHNQL